MKTEYNIIWVDDELDTVVDDMSDIREFFESFGIEAHIKEFGGDEEQDVHERLRPSLEDPNLDLIVVDYLMDGMNGRDLINQIRESDHIFLPVIFYSSAGVRELHAQAASASLDGVYIADRNRVRHKIEEVATSLLRKEQTTKRTRGLLMEGVSEIDARFALVFENLWSVLEAEKRAALIKYFAEKLDERAERAKSLRAALPEDQENFLNEMKANFVSSAYDTIIRWKILKKMLELAGRKDQPSEIFSRLYNRVEGAEPLIGLRNVYGHRTRAELERDHSHEKCVGIRRELRTQLTNLDTLND